mmetsp:Transcript_9401/g.18933  ORF Transcript_9401/g.18933 Transcript_9401/m.18933 type:complete len:253 (-) Transcript_9401:111-869(-)
MIANLLPRLKYNHNRYHHFCRRKMSENTQYIPTSTAFQPRYTGPSPENMTPEQTALRQSILESRPRTGLSGPFGPWLAVPSIARPSQELGRTVRYETSLSMRESELVILLTGAKFKSEAEFDIHVGEAMRAGVGLDVIKSIPRGALLSQEGRKDGKDNNAEFSLENVKKHMLPLLEKENAYEGKGDLLRDIPIVLFTAELLETNAVSDETYAKTKRLLGGDDSVLVEITAIVGYYAYVAYTLNVFRIASSSS